MRNYGDPDGSGSTSRLEQQILEELDRQRDFDPSEYVDRPLGTVPLPTEQQIEDYERDYAIPEAWGARFDGLVADFQQRKSYPLERAKLAALLDLVAWDTDMKKKIAQRDKQDFPRWSPGIFVDEEQ